MKRGRGYTNQIPKPKTLMEVFAELDNTPIEEGEMFPILMSAEEWRKDYISPIPREIPTAFVKQFEKQILKNHCNQSIKELKRRGGLHPTELCAAMYGVDFHVYFGKTPITDGQTVFAINMIMMKLNDFKEKEKS